MTTFLLSLDEIARVKKLRHIRTNAQLAEVSGLSRKTWTTALTSRRPTPQVLDALAALGARHDRVLVAEDTSALTA